MHPRLRACAPGNRALSRRSACSVAYYLVVAGAVSACVVAASACGDAGSGARVERAVIVPSAGTAPPTLYFAVRHRGEAPLALEAITVDGAARVAVYAQHQHEVGVPVASAEVPAWQLWLPAYGVLRFAPGAIHGMLLELQRPLTMGETRRLTIRLANGDSVSGDARVVAYADVDDALSPSPRLRRLLAAGGRIAATLTGAPTGRASAPSVEEGRALYLANGCASCHGPEGHGDGPVAKTLTPPPRDLRDVTAFKNRTDPASIAQTIAEGIVGGGAMPRFAHLDAASRQSLALYVVALRLSPSTPSTRP
ncbi:MAG: copper chaperone PCu(A)C [Gemmatimonadota bacterium]|nr:copper chaperone PCu(A)C [Gemmatimonadota bacterium]